LAAPVKIIFVCLGNIVRSPLAENKFRHLAQQSGVAEKYTVASGAVADWHVGDPPDSRMRRVAKQHGLIYNGRGRQITRQDMQTFDLVMAMDRENGSYLRRLAGSAQEEAKIHMLREFDPMGGPTAVVPDPYYGNLDEFEEVYQIIERSCQGLLEALQNGELSI
jgi:protein-tyrosine phosphatase